MKVKENNFQSLKESNIIKQLNTDSILSSIEDLFIIDCFIYDIEHDYLCPKTIVHFEYKNVSYSVGISVVSLFIIDNIFDRLKDMILNKISEIEQDKVIEKIYEMKDFAKFNEKDVFNIIDDYVFVYTIKEDFLNIIKYKIVNIYTSNKGENYFNLKIKEYENNKLLNKIDNKKEIKKGNKI